MEIRRCYPLPIRISAWGAYDALSFNSVLLPDAMKEAYHFYCRDDHDGVYRAAHVQVKHSEIKEDNGTYKIHHDGTYTKLSDEFLTLEQILDMP
jgi:hypothetical protein